MKHHHHHHLTAASGQRSSRNAAQPAKKNNIINHKQESDMQALIQDEVRRFIVTDSTERRKRRSRRRDWKSQVGKKKNLHLIISMHYIYANTERVSQAWHFDDAAGFQWLDLIEIWLILLGCFFRLTTCRRCITLKNLFHICDCDCPIMPPHFVYSHLPHPSQEGGSVLQGTMGEGCDGRRVSNDMMALGDVHATYMMLHSTQKSGG